MFHHHSCVLFLQHLSQNTSFNFSLAAVHLADPVHDLDIIPSSQPEVDGPSSDMQVAVPPPKRMFNFRHLTQKKSLLSPKTGRSVISVIERAPHATAMVKSRSFAKPTSEDHLLKLSRKQFASETDKKIRWVVNMYGEWCKYRNSVPGFDIIKLDLMNVATITKANLVYAATRFLAEVKKMDGSDFPPKTLYEILVTLQFHLETLGFSWKLLDDEAFKDLRFTLDNLMKVRCRSGLGNNVKQAQVITFQEEDLMWSKGILGVDTPQKLLDTLVYMLGLSCALRAGKEHRALRSLDHNSQFCIKYDDEGYKFLFYREDLCNKTNRGGIKHKKYTGKTVSVYPASNLERCPVTILELYMSKLPSLRKNNCLYLRPLTSVSTYCDIWYKDAPVGVNTLQGVVKKLCKEAGLVGHYSNHSLRATAATRMYHGGNDEQVIQEHTGHRSLCVRSYKKTCNSQKRKACDSIYCRKEQAKFMKMV